MDEKCGGENSESVNSRSVFEIFFVVTRYGSKKINFKLLQKIRQNLKNTFEETN